MRKGHPGHSVSPFRLRRLHRHQQSMMLSGQNGRAAPAEELRGRAATVQRICTCLNNGSRELNVGESGLTALPDRLPAHITTLVIPHNNYLTSLPTLPSGLEVLTVEDNQLTSLPPLPAGLQMLSVAGNQLTRLPALPSGLQRLYAHNNQLTRLPESITGLSSEASVNLEGNPLSERTLQALQNITSAPGYSGPGYYSIWREPQPREARALHWRPLAGWCLPGRANRLLQTDGICSDRKITLLPSASSWTD